MEKWKSVNAGLKLSACQSVNKGANEVFPVQKKIKHKSKKEKKLYLYIKTLKIGKFRIFLLVRDEKPLQKAESCHIPGGGR